LFKSHPNLPKGKEIFMNKNKEHIILKTENLSIGYQQKKQQKVIGKNINIEIEKGKFIALVGENGIGKSTLLRTLSNVQNPLKGKILFNDKLLSEYSALELSKTFSLVLTERLPESQLTVFEIIAIGRQPYTNWIDQLSEKDIEKINWAIELTEINHLQHEKFYQLSDGQLQRVLIARALAQDTAIIILDEPTAHLDIHNKFNVFSLLKKLVKTTNKTIIISTHEINLAIQLVDEFILFTKDNLVHDSTSRLIENNQFSSIFNSKIINFDVKTNQFIITKND